MSFIARYPNTADNIRMALGNDAFYQAMLASANNSPQKLNAYLDYSMQEAQQYGALVTSEEANQGAAIWSLPIDTQAGQLKTQAKKDFLLSHMGKNSLTTYLAIADFMDQQSANVVNDDDWYLSILGINPNLQGRGLGQALLTPTLELADQQGKACYLETYTPRNMSFYARLGFIAKHQAYEPTCQHHYWIMVRQPQRN